MENEVVSSNSWRMKVLLDNFLKAMKYIGRKIKFKLFPQSFYLGGFDKDYYLQNYPDVAASGMDPLEHYVLYGQEEGRFKSEEDEIAKVMHDRNSMEVIKKQIDDNNEYIQNFRVLASYLGAGDNSKKYSEKSVKMLEDYTGDKAVLLVTHEASLTGAPIVLLHLAKCLQDKGYFPVLLSPDDGKLVSNFLENDIPVIVHEEIFSDEFAFRIRKLFKFIVVNTIICAPVINLLANTDTRVLWWIHEARINYSSGILTKLPMQVSNNIRIYAVSEYAMSILKEYRPCYDIGLFSYYVPDFAGEVGSQTKDFKQRKKFVCVGTLEKRKAQDVLVDAIDLLDEGVRNKCEFVFVGANRDDGIYGIIENALKKYPNCVSYISELSRQEIKKLYVDTDYLVCPSKDDPLPCVITESLMMSKPVICSDNTGSAHIVRETGAGWVYGNNDARELASLITYCAEHRVSDAMRAAARNAYLDFFSYSVFAKNFETILEKTEDNTVIKPSVSVVIPSFNASKDFPVLFKELEEQEGLTSLEIIVVDSGSSDNTVAICRQHHVKLLQITQEQFSHSYARNLGAGAAVNNYLVMMTQDARPTSKHWLADFVKPLYEEGVAAVSCQEVCPDGTDFYHRINSYSFSKFMKFNEGDRIVYGAGYENKTELRQNANLNDVACAINKIVLKNFGYRYNYAEDLDLGIRLLQNGYKIKFMSSVQVWHGHNRSVSYCLHRYIVDVVSVDKILSVVNLKTETDFMDYLVAVVILEETITITISKKFLLLDEFLIMFRSCLNGTEKHSKGYFIKKSSSLVLEKDVKEITDKIIDYEVKRDDIVSFTMLKDLITFYDMYITKFVKKYDCTMMDVCDAMRKRLMCCLAVKLAHVGKDSELYPIVCSLQSGV